MRDLLELLGAVERQSAERLAATAQPGQLATVVMMLFEMPDQARFSPSLRCRMDATGGARAAVWEERQASLDAFSPPSWTEPAAGRKEGATRTQPPGPRCSLVRGDRPDHDSRAPA
jgi:hypothetical protein